MAAGLTAAVLALCGLEARTAAAAVPCTTDEFAGTGLDGTRWSVLRPDAGGAEVAGGRLALALRPGALDATVATARNVVLQDTPAGGWTATARLATGTLGAPGDRAGLVLWRAEGDGQNAFATATFTRTATGAARFELRITDRSVLALPAARSGADAPGLPADAAVLVRLRSDGSEVHAAYSADEGATWTAIGGPAQLPGASRVGLVAMGGGGVAAFDRFTLSCGPQVELTSTPDRGMVTMEIGARVELADDHDEPLDLGLVWDFGDASGGGGGMNRFHKYAVPGTYRPTVWATDADGNVTRASASVTALASSSPCPAASDEFAGNGLDPYWSVLRPVPTGLAVHGGRLWLRPYAGAPATARNAVVRPAPAGPWTATTVVDVAALDAPGDRAGLALARGNALVHVGFHRTGEGTFAVAGGDGATATPPGPAPDRLHLRVGSDGALPATLSAHYSLDGTDWAPAGGPFTLGGPGQLQVGVAALGSSVSEPAGFDHLRFAGPRPCGEPDTVPPETTHELERDGAAVRVHLLAADDVTGSGVARTEHRVGAAPFAPYAGPLVLTAPGSHDVAYRSIDRAGNVEATRHARVEIAAPPDDGPRDGDGGGVLGPVPRGIGDRTPVARPAARLLAPTRARLSLRRLLRAGLRVRAACSGVAVGQARLVVTRATARRLGLGRRTTLARRGAPCDGRLATRLVVDRRVRKALRTGPRSFAATLEVRAGRSARDRLRVRFA